MERAGERKTQDQREINGRVPFSTQVKIRLVIGKNRHAGSCNQQTNLINAWGVVGCQSVTAGYVRDVVKTASKDGTRAFQGTQVSILLW